MFTFDVGEAGFWDEDEGSKLKTKMKMEIYGKRCDTPGIEQVYLTWYDCYASPISDRLPTPEPSPKVESPAST